MIDAACIRLICFDVDGTLSDTDEQYLKRIAPWLHPFAPIFRRDPGNLARGLVYSMETPGTLLLEMLDRLHLDNTANQASEMIDRLLASRRKPSYLLVDGVLEMLNLLQQHYSLAVVSARGKRKTMAFLDYFELAGYFSFIVTGQTCERTKPHPDPILWAAEQAGVLPGECLMIGDTTTDIRAGRAAGAQTVGVLCGFGKEAELRQAGADLILPQTRDILNVLRLS